MSQLFSFPRWVLLVTRHWSENRRIYWLSLTAIAALMLLWFILVLFANPYQPLDMPMQGATYFVGLFLCGCIFGSLLFADLGSKTKGQNYLQLPASHLEKLLCNLFFGVIVFFICFTLVFYLVDVTMVRIADSIAYKHWLKMHDGSLFEKGEVVNVFIMPYRANGAPNIFYFFLLAYFALQSAFILGSVYFARFSFIKTVISLLVAGLFITFLVMKLMHYILPYGDFHGALTSYRVFHVTHLSDGGISYTSEVSDKIVALPGLVNDILIFLLKYAFAPIFWVTTYFRLKEKEI